MLDLGKYAFAVLASYGVGLGLIGVLIWASWRRNARMRAELDRFEQRRRHGGN